MGAKSRTTGNLDLLRLLACRTAYFGLTFIFCSGINRRIHGQIPLLKEVLMRKYFAAIFLCLLFPSFACKTRQEAAKPDWLLKPEAFKAKIEETSQSKSIILDNGLVRRTLRLVPDCATIDYQNLMTGEAVVRAARPEAILVIDGKKSKWAAIRFWPAAASAKRTTSSTRKPVKPAAPFLETLPAWAVYGAKIISPGSRTSSKKQGSTFSSTTAPIRAISARQLGAERKGICARLQPDRPLDRKNVDTAFVLFRPERQGEDPRARRKSENLSAQREARSSITSQRRAERLHLVCHRIARKDNP